MCLCGVGGGLVGGCRCRLNVLACLMLLFLYIGTGKLCKQPRVRKLKFTGGEHISIYTSGRTVDLLLNLGFDF